MRPMIDARRPARAWQHAGETGPPVDLFETSEAVIIRLAVPGTDRRFERTVPLPTPVRKDATKATYIT